MSGEQRHIHVLNLGAGVQSTALALMSHKRIAPDSIPVFDCAIFADTQGEPKAVYDHLAWLMAEVASSFPVIIRSQGNLAEHLKKGTNSTGGRFASIPAFTAAKEGAKAEGMVRRQCTKEYKTDVIEKAIRRDVLGLEPRKRRPKDVTVHQYLGLSYDEPNRIFGKGNKPGVKDRILGRGYVPHFPLYELMLTREHLRGWLSRYGIPHRVPRSACTFCPYRSDAEWINMREHDPESFAHAVDVDNSLRVDGNVFNRNMDQKLYLHRSCRPLAAVDFKPKCEHEKQMDLTFAAIEREGMCGV